MIISPSQAHDYKFLATFMEPREIMPLSKVDIHVVPRENREAEENYSYLQCGTDKLRHFNRETLPHHKSISTYHSQEEPFWAFIKNPPMF